MEANTVVGAIGTALAFCEIWKPGVSVQLEEFIGETIDFVLEYKKDTVEILGIAARNTEIVAREVIK